MKQITDNPELYQQLVELYGKERADKMIADKQRKSQEIRAAGVAYKSQRPAPTIAELQAKQKTLSARIHQTATAAKDAMESAEAESVRELLDLAYQLDLNENAVLELVKQYSLSEVMTILRTLSTVKSAGKGFKSVFFGVTTDSPDISDIRTALQDAHKAENFWR